MSVPCQTKWRSAQATACAAGCCSNGSITLMSPLPVLPRLGASGRGRSVSAGAVDQPAYLAQLVGARAAGRERLHHQLRRRPPERAIQQIADELPLRLVLAEPRAIHVRPIPFVAID